MGEIGRLAFEGLEKVTLWLFIFLLLFFNRNGGVFFDGFIDACFLVEKGLFVGWVVCLNIFLAFYLGIWYLSVKSLVCHIDFFYPFRYSNQKLSHFCSLRLLNRPSGEPSAKGEQRIRILHKRHVERLHLADLLDYLCGGLAQQQRDFHLELLDRTLSGLLWGKLRGSG